MSDDLQIRAFVRWLNLCHVSADALLLVDFGAHVPKGSSGAFKCQQDPPGLKSLKSFESLHLVLGWATIQVWKDFEDGGAAQAPIGENELVR